MKSIIIKKKQNNLLKKGQLFYLMLFCFFSMNFAAQDDAHANGAKDDYINNETWSWTIDDDDNSPNGYYRWWNDGGEKNSELGMELSFEKDRKLSIHGASRRGILELTGGSLLYGANTGHLDIEVSSLGAYFTSSGVGRGIFLTSTDANRVHIGDHNDEALAYKLASESFVITDNINHFGIPLNERLRIGSENNHSYIKSLSDPKGLILSSSVGNKITLGDSTDIVKVTKNLEVDGNLVLKNNEIPTSPQEGTLYYDRNHYSRLEGGQGFFEKDGGGLALYNGEDGWSALIDTKNMDNLKANFRSVKVLKNLEVNGNLVLKNNELPTAPKEGTLYYDRNHFSRLEGGHGFFEKDGGGLALYNIEDGWSALIDTKNMDNLKAQFRTLYLKTAEPKSNGAYTYDFKVDNGVHIGYKIGTGLVDGTNNSTKMAIALKTDTTIKNPNYLNAVEFISDKDLHIIDTYFNRNVYAGESFAIKDTDDLKLGLGAGKDIPNDSQGTHVFIGKDAGNKSGFDDIAVIDFSDPANTNPITGREYLNNNSVFVLNNSSDLTKPLLFGNFADNSQSNSMAQLAINTHHIIDSVALTVSGAVHIGPKNLDPTIFPSKEGYEDALLWVEKGIVTENVTYAFTSDWKDWPDYVFEEDYDLMKLNELETYIRKEKHLPGIVSKDEVKKEGLKSREMIANLLLKIEELTLYTIDQEKKIEVQKQQNKTLLDRLTAIEKQLLKNN